MLHYLWYQNGSEIDLLREPDTDEHCRLYVHSPQDGRRRVIACEALRARLHLEQQGCQ